MRSMGRRTFLVRSAQAGLVLSGIGCSGGRERPRTPPADASDLERLGYRLMEVDRSDAPTRLATLLEEGHSPAELFDALTAFAAARVDSHHTLFVLPAAREAAELEGELALFWTLDSHHSWHDRHGFEGRRPALRGHLPKVSEAEAVYRRAMHGMDRDAAERAFVVLGRDAGRNAALEAVWEFGARDWSFIGHRAIAPAMLAPTIDRAPDSLLEPLLRTLNDNLFFFGAQTGAKQGYPANVERVARSYDELPGTWSALDSVDDESAKSATLDLVGTIRTGRVDDACNQALDLLLAGTLRAAEVWDAVHLGASELLARLDTDSNGGQEPMHSNSAAAGLRTAFERSRRPRTQLLVVLQAVAWVAEYTRRGIDDGLLDDFSALSLEFTDIDASREEALDRVLHTLQPVRGVPVHPPATRESQRRAYLLALALTHDGGGGLFVDATLRHALRKSRADAHDLKIPHALFDVARRVHPRWRSIVRATAVHWLHPAGVSDSDLFEQYRELRG